MEKTEMIEELVKKVNITNEEARKILEECNWDLFDAIIFLEREGKIENANVNETIILEKKENTKEESYRGENQQNNKNTQEESGGVGEVIGRVFRFIGKIFKRGNRTYFVATKDEEKPIKISLTVFIILSFLAFWFVGVVLVVGLFTGYKYSIISSRDNYDAVNNILGKVSKSAENIKSDFQKGYNEK